jgi:transposase
VNTMTKVPDPEVPARAKTRTYSAAYKARVLAEYESLDKAGKGALLRREGLYTSLISAWREQRDRAVKQALGRPAGRPKADPRDRELAELRRTLARSSAVSIRPPRPNRYRAPTR